MSSNKSQSKPPNVYDTAQKTSQKEEIKGEEQTIEDFDNISDSEGEEKKSLSITKPKMEI